MPRSTFRSLTSLRRQTAPRRTGGVLPEPAQVEHTQQVPGHHCDGQCPLLQASGGSPCSVNALTSGDCTIGRTGFLRGLGTLAGAAALGGVMGPLGGVFSPVPKTMAAGKPTNIAKRGGLWLGNARTLTPAQALTYSDPGSGDPALLLRLPSGQYVSFDAGCTHGTCTVDYDPRRRLMVCPCHGATFDPARNAAVLLGPARDPLYPLPIRVDAAGDVYYLDAAPGPRVNRLKKAPPYTGQTGDDSGDGGGSTGHGGEGGDSLSRQASRSTQGKRPASGRDA